MTELTAISIIAAWVTALSAVVTIGLNWYFRYIDKHYTTDKQHIISQL